MTSSFTMHYAPLIVKRPESRMVSSPNLFLFLAYSFMGEMGEEGDQPFKFDQLEDQQGYPGLAVKKESYDRNGELESTEVTKSMETQKTDPARYQLPVTDPPLEETDSPFDQMPTDMPVMPPGY